MELIIVIFFFALTSAVCLQVFIKAHDVGKDTEGLNYATLWADNASECFYEYGNDEALIRATLDSSFNLTDYNYELKFSSDDVYDYMTFSFFYNVHAKKIMSTTFKRHIQEVAK